MMKKFDENWFRLQSAYHNTIADNAEQIQKDIKEKGFSTVHVPIGTVNLV